MGAQGCQQTVQQCWPHTITAAPLPHRHCRLLIDEYISAVDSSHLGHLTALNVSVNGHPFLLYSDAAVHVQACTSSAFSQHNMQHRMMHRTDDTTPCKHVAHTLV
ncbi:TPA: hypothetical protein ACH3X2_000089 [Trebouxia sp. C0005]